MGSEFRILKRTTELGRLSPVFFLKPLAVTSVHCRSHNLGHTNWLQRVRLGDARAACVLSLTLRVPLMIASAIFNFDRFASKI